MHEKNVTITYEYNYKYNPEGYLEASIVSFDVPIDFNAIIQELYILG